jgi:hypothetical protein
MKNLKPNSTVRPRGWFAPLLLFLVLAALFWRSFEPGIVHFSNDGPLGMQNAAWLHLPEALTGQWYDLNSIGSNGGQSSPDILTLIRWVLQPVGYAKFLAPIALWILGVGAWFFFRQLQFSPLAATLGGLAAALNSTFFSTACWGVAAQQIATGMDFFALGLIVANTAETPALTRWTRLALAGLCVGINVMEAADIGAIFSLFVAAFVFFKALNEEDAPALKKIGRGILRTAAVAGFAGLIAMQTVTALIGSSITGIAGTGQDTETKAAHWDWATQWSLPKSETLAILVPGLFGYKMDTPNNMMPALQEFYKNGEYWGGVGRDPAIDRYFDSGRQGPPPASGFMRFTGGGTYAGILVALLAAWAIAQSFRRENSVFSASQKRFIWFWTAALALSLPLAWGRFAPFSKEYDSPGFYALLYHLPYFSTIRNPAKFINVFSWVIVILFGYGVHALNRRYLEVPANGSSSPSTQLVNWWAKVRGFDRHWTIGCGVAVVVSVLGWLVYSAQMPALVKYLQRVGFPDESSAKAIAAFSCGQVVWFIFYLAAAVLLCTLVMAGVFAGKRAKLGGILLGALLLLDLGRANLPWITHWDYAQKYASNPIVDFLKEKPFENRVAYGLPRPLSTPSQFGLFSELYSIEWAQHHFPYYNIQSLDVIQMSRMPADLAAFDGNFQIGVRQDASGQLTVAPETFPRVARLWELTSTRYLLGPASLLDLYNQQFDPSQQRFRILQRFDVVNKPGIEHPTKLEELTAVTNDNGPYALFEFTGALPRVKLYSHWQVSTNDEATLKMLADKNFDPQQAVLVATPQPTAPSTNQNAGTVEFKSYKPTDIVFDAKAETPSVLLLNDRYDSNWRVRVDGKPAQLLRCNYIMRGVYLTAGPHTVEFQFSLPTGPLKITLAAIAIGFVLLGLLIFLQRRQPAAES